MFFDDEDDVIFDHEVFHVVRREFYTLSSNLDVSPFGLRSVPTHTEDGIPIRKLYVSNLPPKTTRTELFGVFAQYGFIKSCWLRMAERGFNRSPTPTYAFVTFSNPADAHKALQAPVHEKTLRGRNLRISPADSWHQPSEDADGNVRWSNNRREDGRSTPSWTNDLQNGIDSVESSETVESEIKETSDEVTDEPQDESEEPYNILDILNRDCFMHILSYVPIRDLIRSERVSKQWQNMIQEYLQGIRLFKTSWWQHVPVTLTTAVLRRVLQRVGGALLRLHIDHHWSALNDRTAHTVGKFCPNLEELKVVGMHTKNWNPLIYGCKQLRSLSFVSCNKLTDSSLVHLVKSDYCIESLLVANNTHVTGLFLTGSNPSKLSSLSFYNCYSLQGSVLHAAVDTLQSLTTLKLDLCPIAMWKIIPLILCKLPKLKELSLSEYTSSELCLPSVDSESFCNAMAGLKDLRILNLCRNIYITNAVLKAVAQACTKLESLNISSCNSKKSFPVSGVSDEGVTAVCAACISLSRLDLSYLARLSDAGVLAAARLPRLAALTARGNPALSDAPFEAVLRACPVLQELDVCGCDNVSGALVGAARAALRAAPRALALRLAATAATTTTDDPQHTEYEKHRLLTVDLYEDRSNPHLRPDFVEDIFEENSDVSFDDMLYDDEDYNFLNGEDGFLDDDDYDDYEEALEFRGQMGNMFFL